MLDRYLSSQLLKSLGDTPVVFLQGARQVGKSTLVKSLKASGHARRYLTLDDATTLFGAQADPTRFIDALDGPVILDEVQRVPALALAIKKAVDERRAPGRFLLTGSAGILVLPRLADALAGRIAIHTLWPLSAGELVGQRGSFIDTLFLKPPSPVQAPNTLWPRLIQQMAKGGYPEAVERTGEDRRGAWFSSYVATLIQRDIRDLSAIRDWSDLPRLLTLAASRAGSLIDYAEFGRTLAIPQTTLKRYFALLEATFLVHRIPAWFTNFGKRLAKAPKLLISDTGLLMHQLGLSADRLENDPALRGHVVENFAAMELIKQLGWSRTQASLFHFRTHAGDEVDLVLEDRSGRIVGVEVKSGATVDERQFKGLRLLAEAAGKRFLRGIVLYSGRESVPFGKNLWAMPISALWHADAT